MIALVLSAHLSDKKRTRAGIDLALTLATFETPFSLFIVGPAQGCLVQSEHPQSPSRRLAALPLYGLDTWFCEHPIDQAISGTQVLGSDEIKARIRACDQVIRV